MGNDLLALGLRMPSDWRSQTRHVDVRPGDALQCDVRIEHLSGHDNELISERYAIVKVNAVLVDSFRQQELDLRGS